MSAGRQWKSHHSVYATFSLREGISVYLSEREARRAKKPGDVVAELHVMQEMDRSWQPLFPEDAS